MKFGTTAASAFIAAAIIAAIAWFEWPIHRPRAMPSGEHPSLASQPAGSLASSPAAMPRAAAAPSVADLTRRTIQSLSSDDARVQGHGISQLLPELVTLDAVAAARVADLFMDSPLRPQILHVIARGWTHVNRLHALDWAQGLSDARERETLLVEIFAQIAQSDPADAVRLRQEYSREQPDDPELPALAQRWAESDLSAVLGWTESLPPGGQRDQLTARAAYIQSQTNPAEAAQLVLDRIPQGEAQTEALISVVHQWAQRDEAAASEWVARIPEDLLRERATQELEASRRARP